MLQNDADEPTAPVSDAFFHAVFFICYILCEREAFENDIVRATKDCTTKELGLITDMAVAMKESMRKREYK